MLKEIDQKKYYSYLNHSWNGLTSMEHFSKSPIIIDRGEGCWLYDIHGKKYFDGNASMWTNAHGHNHPEMNQAIINQLGKLAHTTYVSRTHTATLELTNKLIQIAPKGLSRVFFTNNGSTSIETALKQSFRYWQLTDKVSKTEVISLEEGYHGLSFGALSVTDSKAMKSSFESWCFKNTPFSSPACEEYGGKVFFEDYSESLFQLEKLLNQNHKNIASIILEPGIQSVAKEGLNLLPKGFLKGIRRLCNEYEVHLILDEIFVGFGRTGSFFVCLEEGVTPDFLCLGKAITGGYLPMGATLTTEEVFQVFNQKYENLLVHGHSYGANPLASVASHKSIELLETMIKSNQLEETVHYFEKRIVHYFEGHPYIKKMRQRGLVCGIEIKDLNTPLSYHTTLAQKICEHARARSLLIRAYKNTIFIIPPLAISPEEIDFLCETISTTIIDYIENYYGK